GAPGIGARSGDRVLFSPRGHGRTARGAGARAAARELRRRARTLAARCAGDAPPAALYAEEPDGAGRCAGRLCRLEAAGRRKPAYFTRARRGVDVGGPAPRT